jgi:hypothetical protein
MRRHAEFGWRLTLPMFTALISMQMYEVPDDKILITTWGRLDGFTPELLINKQVAPVVSQSLKISQPFPPKVEAESFALQVAKTLD